MSDYWDAVGRAALGRSGTAAPRPRSIFEPEVTGSPVDNVDAIVEEVATEPSPAPAVKKAPPPGEPRSDDAPDTRIVEAEPAREAEAIPVRRSQDDSRREEPTRPISMAPTRPSTDERTATTIVERVEILRTESTQVVLQAPAPSTMPATEPPPRTTAASVASDELGDPTGPRDEIAQHPKADVAAPFAVAAEPRVVVTDRVAAGPEGAEAPLVIEIDRIEIRIEPEHVAPIVAPQRRAAPAAPSLSDYLARYGEQAQ